MKRDAIRAQALVTPALIDEARRGALAAGTRPLDALEERLALPAEQFVAHLAQAFHYGVASMDDLNAMASAFDLVPFGEAVNQEILPLRAPDGHVVVAFADPFRTGLQERVEARLPGGVEWLLAHAADLAAYFSRHEEGMRAMDGVLGEPADAGVDEQGVEDLSIKSISEDTSPVVKLVHSTLYDAHKSGASDIHLESDAAGLAIRYRIDGVLATVGRISGVEQAEQVLSRIKIMSELDIAERRVPQDGRFKVAVRGREVDFRVSVMPSIFGEDAVLRILDRRALTDHVKGLRLDHLGFDEDTMARVRRLAAAPYGMLLVTGPTGSGKTTTLYAVISEINSGQDKIVTIEDPIDTSFRVVLQIPVNEKKGLTFARGLRSILRHDPDKIMVGEIRDSETAQIAIQSALTGHLVLTTVHANTAFDVIGRFVHMQIDTYSFMSALNGVLAQRLVRKNCPQCAKLHAPDAELLALSGIPPEAAAGYRFMQGAGCGHCRGTGFKGRRAIAEVLVMNDEIRELITAREPIRVIREAATRAGVQYLRDAALELVRRGETTLQEINRVSFVA